LGLEKRVIKLMDPENTLSTAKQNKTTINN
jgi:hypothetical protein